MKRRSGFTLVELLVVVSIILVMATLTMMAFSGRNTDKMRSGARVVQSAMLGAKDRALHSKTFRGFRLTRDAQGPTFIVGGTSNGIPCLATGFTYTQPIQHDPYQAASIQLERVDVDGTPGADSSDVSIIHATGTDWAGVWPFFNSPGQIRIPAQTGQWYQFTIDTSGPYALSPGNLYLRLVTPYNGAGAVPMPAVVAYVLSNTSTNSCEIQFGNEVLPFHQPIAFPAGVVIDLRYCSSNVQQAAGASLSSGTTPPNIDISFSPRGSVSGAAGGSGAIYLALRDLADATGPDSRTGTAPRDPSDPQSQGEILIVALNPQTGLVQTYEADLRDSNGDNVVDDLFTFARAGKAAGR